MISVLFVIYEVPLWSRHGPRLSAPGGKSHQPLSLELGGGYVICCSSRLQASLGFISPGWILFEGTVVRKQRETERGEEKNIL